MKEKLKKYAKYLLEFAKSNKITCICFLLAISVAVTGTASFAKYVSGDPINSNPNAATFHCYAEIDDVSALTFTNMAFWGGLEDIGVSMNSLRNVSIDVNNYEVINGVDVTTGVLTDYSLIFEAPQNFSSKLALQLIGENDKVLTSQIVLSDIISCVSASNPSNVFKTQDPLYNGKKYSGVTQEGNIVSYMTFDVFYDSAADVYTATSRDKDGTVITIEPFINYDMDQTLYFRLWDVESKGEEQVELESGTLMPPLIMTFKQDIPFYRITISRPDFKLPAGVPTTDSYNLSLAPIDALLDTHLGGYLMEQNNNGDFVYARTLQAGQEIHLSTVVEVSSTNDGSGDRVTLMGSVPTYIVGKVEENEIGQSVRETTYHAVYTSTKTEETSTTDSAHTKYYTYRSTNRRWSNSNSTSGLYKIENHLVTTTKTTTVYNIMVREVTDITESVKTTYVSDDEMLVNQSVEKNETTTIILLDATKKVTTEVSYSEKYVYYERSNTSANWGTGKTSFSVTFNGTYPTSYEKQNPHQDEQDNVFLTADEIEELKKVAEVKDKLNTLSTKTKYDRTITYTSSNSPIMPTSIYTADDSVSLYPFETHIVTKDGIIQKYYVSTSYSKNYPFFVKVHFEQTRE